MILLTLAAGLLPVGHLQFDPPGITIAGRNWAYTIPWDNISQMSLGDDYLGNPALLIWLRFEDLVEVRPPGRKAKVMKRLAWCTEWVGAPVVVGTTPYGLDLPLLAQALERYIRDSSTRAELSRGRVERAGAA